MQQPQISPRPKWHSITSESLAQHSRKTRPLLRWSGAAVTGSPGVQSPRAGDLGPEFAMGPPEFSSRANELSGGDAIIVSVPKADARGFAHSCAPTSANASASNLHCGLDVTTSPAFRVLYFLTTCLSTARKEICGTGCAGSIWCRAASLPVLRSFCSPGIRGIVLFLSICS